MGQAAGHFIPYPDARAIATMDQPRKLTGPLNDRVAKKKHLTIAWTTARNRRVPNHLSREIGTSTWRSI
jgi:hypothetical protein